MKRELISLRSYMEENNLDAYIIPSTDAHQGEYVADYFQGRKWITGFSGSAGISIILKHKAGLWTDGRYFIQAEKELKGSGFTLFKTGEKNVPTYIEWLFQELKDGAKIGFDGRVISQDDFLKLDMKLKVKNIRYCIDSDALDIIWVDRPELPKDKIFILDKKFAGVSRETKIANIRSDLKDKKSDMYIISSLDDIAWLLNLRGSDIKNTPLFYSYVIVEKKKTTLFIEKNKIKEDILKVLNNSSIEVKNYKEIGDYLNVNTKRKKVICNPSKTSRYVYSFLDKDKVINQEDITTQFKALKNQVERKHIRDAYKNDCVALIKFFNHIEKNSHKITELEAEKILEKYRMEDDLFIYNSFDPIVAYGDHAAMMHFKATKDNSYSLKKKGLFLVDSGGQYFNGTTDITRTLVMGELSHEEKLDFTIALQGLIELSSTRFLKGTTGSALDTICRKPIWNQGINYRCGTGHGIGFFLNIHELPYGFGPRPSYNLPLDENMLLTIEPGVYKEDRHGVRHENTVFVKKYTESEFGIFYEFETISYFPFDTRGILISELTPFQIEWINNYHKKTYDILSPYLNGDDLEWLKKRTKSI